MNNVKRLSVIAAIAFVAAIAGVLLGRVIFPERPSAGIELHKVLHEEIDLDAAQLRKLADIERRFAVRRQALELQLRAYNAQLAAAIEAEHGNGPRVAAAVDASHGAMGELQKETLAHVFAMRQLLRPAQTAKFDRAVVQALTADGR